MQPENKSMFCTIIIARYPKYLGVFGFMSMAIFRLPLYFNKKIKFYKLMGSGKNGTFDLKPDLNQWAILFTTENVLDKMPGFIYNYFSFFKCAVKEFLMQPVEGHGLWDKKKVFGELKNKLSDDEVIATLTRATIRLNRLKNFWRNVAGVANKMATAKGLIASFGIGETPWIKQATFSIWQNKSAMKDFAYSMQEHSLVIKKTRSENWYSEELFVRFRIIAVKGMELDNLPSVIL